MVHATQTDVDWIDAVIDFRVKVMHNVRYERFVNFCDEDTDRRRTATTKDERV